MSNLIKIKNLFFLALIGFTSLQAQTYEFKGEVLDSLTKIPLDYTSVYIETTSGKIIGFTNTNEKGMYRFSCTLSINDSLQITANMLGYKKKSHPVIISAETIITENFSLSAAAFELEEIIVRESSLPVIEKNDTTTYKVSAYIDSTEYSVEDVLKKLPGVQVGEAGGITVNGKPITKVLIEGDDMFGHNYTIGTRNIRANMIDKVQVINNYQDNPVLKDVKSSDDVVLNLSIKEEKKNIITGTYTLGTGYGKELKNYLHTNIVSLSKKSKTFLLGNYNNNGFDAIGELSANFTDFSFDDQSIDNHISKPHSLIQLPVFQNIGLPEKFSNRRRLRLGNLSQVVNVTPTFKVKLSGTYHKEKNEQEYFQQNIFFSSEETTNYNESSNYSNQNLFAEIILQTDYLSTNHNSSLKTYSNLTGEGGKVNLSLERTENKLMEPISQFAKERPTHIYNALEYTRRLGDYTATQFIASHSFNKNNQQLNSIYSQYADFFNLENFNQLGQESNISQHLSQVIIRYLYSKHISFSLDLGYSNKYTQLLSATNLSESDVAKGNVSIFTNAIAIKQSTPKIKALLKKQLLGATISIGGNISIESIENSLTPSQTYWLLNPFLQLKKTFNGQSNFRLLYLYKSELPEISTLNNNFVFTDYQSISKGILNFAPVRGHKLISRFSYKDVLNSFYLNASSHISISNNGIGSAFNFNQNLFNQNLFRPVPLKSWGGNFSIEKLFYDLSSRFLLRYDFNTYFTRNEINTRSQDIRYVTNEIYLDYGSAFDIPFNFYLTNSLRITTAAASSLEESNKLLTWNSKYKLLYRPNKVWHFDVSWYGIYNGITSSFNNFLSSLEMNASFVFERNKKRHELSLSVVNIPNRKKFSINSIDNFSQNQYNLSSVPRFFLIKWDTSL